MIKSLLMDQLNNELIAASQMAYFAGVIKNPSLKERFLKFAKEELEHFSAMAAILFEMGYDASIDAFKLNVESDELKALIILDAIEGTMIHNYEEVVLELKEPFKSRIRDQIQEEMAHSKQMKLLLEEAKKSKSTI